MVIKTFVIHLLQLNKLKRLLLPLLAGLALPTAVNAESYWLILYVRSNYGITNEKIQMESMDQCEEQGQIFLKKKIGGGNKYICLKGK